MKEFLRRNKTALVLSLFYFVPAMLWVLFSGPLFEPGGSPELEKFKNADRLKDASFVVAISLMIFFILHLSRRKFMRARMEYQHLFDEHPQPMWIYDPQTLAFLAVNNAAIAQYQYTREEFLRLSIKDIRPADDIPVLEAHRASQQAGEKNIGIWTHVKKNGEQIVVAISASDVTFQSHPCRLVCAMDITEQHRTRIELKKLSLVAENATNSIIILDKDARIEWTNAAFTQLTGYSLDEIKGKRPDEFLHGPDTDKEAREEIMQCCRNGKPYSGEIINYRKDGSSYWLRLTISPVFAQGKVSNFVTVQTDITELKDQYSQLRDIAFTVSHGLRKPLANIIGLVDLMGVNDNDPHLIEALKISAKALDEEVCDIVRKTSPE